MFRSAKSTGLTIGLLLGIFYAAYTYFLYSIGLQYYTSLPLRAIPFILIILLMIVSVLITRKIQRGVIGFREAMTAAFLVFFTAELLWSVFNHYLYNYIDPGLGEAVRQVTIDLAREDLLAKGKTEEEISRVIGELEYHEYDLSIANTIKGFGFWLIYGSFLSFIIAFIISYFSQLKRV